MFYGDERDDNRHFFNLHRKKYQNILEPEHALFFVFHRDFPRNKMISISQELIVRDKISTKIHRLFVRSGSNARIEEMENTTKL